MALDLESLYIDLHRHPELSFQETRTAGVIARALTELGIVFEEGIGKTGVVAVLEHVGVEGAEGPTVWARADMDALPVPEQTGLEYASTAQGTDGDGNDVPVMHACGHDMRDPPRRARAARRDEGRVERHHRGRVPARRGSTAPAPRP